MADTNQKVFVKNCDDEISIWMEKNHFFGENPEESLRGMSFYEFSLDELGLPSAEELLENINTVRNKIGLKGWKSKGVESQTYKGFSLTYNPDYQGDETSIYHQTWGSLGLTQNYGRVNGLAQLVSKKNSYYDSYSFRRKPPLVEQSLKNLFDRLSMSLVRSRVAWNYVYGKRKEDIEGWHVDELPYHILRINIPLQTSEEHVIDIAGCDEFGNELDIKNKHLEIGKAYIWNTRIPHCVSLKKICQNLNPRIHIVLGVSPWFDYDESDDSFNQNMLHGRKLDYIIKEKLFVKS